MTKKTISVICAAALAVTGLSGCEKNETSVSFEDNLPVVRLALRDGIYADVIEKSLEEYEETHGVHLLMERLSEDELHSAVLGESESGDEYDLCMVDGSWMAECVQKKTLSSLTDLGYEMDDDIIPATKEVCYQGGEAYLVPFYGNVTVLLYNRQLLEKAGYDPDSLTLEDMLTVCEETASEGNLGFMYRGDSNNNYVVDFLPILLSYGGWVVDSDNNPTVDTSEFKEAMEYYLKLIATGRSEQRDDLVIAIANGAAVMAVAWPGWYTPSKNSSADYCALSGKATASSVANNANVYGIWTLGVTAKSSQKEKAEEVLEYLMDSEVQKASVSYGGVPCRYSSLTDSAVLEKYPQYEEVRDALENGIYRPIMVEWPDMYGILGAKMADIIDGNLSVEEGLKQAQQELEALPGLKS